MPEIQILLPDGKQLSFDHEPTVLEVAQKIGPRLAKDTVGGQINDQPDILDLRTKLPNGTKLKIVRLQDEGGLEVIRHSAAHVLAQAVQEIWPEVKVTIGPVIESGFYYDFDSPRTFSESDFLLIEKKMAEIISRNLEIVRRDMSSKEAINTFKEMGERYKVELIEDLNVPEVGIYYQGPWFDLCRGPHLQSTGQIGVIKVTGTSGSYWRGDETRDALTRIYATAFRTQKELDEHLKNLEEAKSRDHRRLGVDLKLFRFHDYSPGAPFFTGRGSIIYNELVSYIRELYFKYDYQEVITPQIFDVEMFKTSGHYANYKDDMFFTRVMDESAAAALAPQAGIKPMNCPGHCALYSLDRYSYRDLPIRMADFGRLHRYERSGAMHGLTRVRSFCQDDGHIFCTQDQIKKEFQDFISLLNEVYSTLGMQEYKVYVATRPENRMGSDEMWDNAEAALKDGLNNLNIPFKIAPGDGAFYGPKVEIHFVDVMKRSWTLGTIQVDFNLPQAFGLKYFAEDNQSYPPVILHRAILGSLERFIGVYLEHVAGRFPTWLSPVQVQVITISEHQVEYAKRIVEALKAEKIRVELDIRSEKLGYKIREAQMMKVPYMVILGDQEVAAEKVALRMKDGSNQVLPLKEFIHSLKNEITTRSLESAFLRTNQEVSN